MDYKKRAIRARNLLGNEEFLGIMKDLREDQLRLIANTSASEVEKREYSQAIFRALNEIEFLLRADVDAEKLIERKARDAHEH